MTSIKLHQDSLDKDRISIVAGSVNWKIRRSARESLESNAICFFNSDAILLEVETVSCWLAEGNDTIATLKELTDRFKKPCFVLTGKEIIGL